MCVVCATDLETSMHAAALKSQKGIAIAMGDSSTPLGSVEGCALRMWMVTAFATPWMNASAKSMPAGCAMVQGRFSDAVAQRFRLAIAIATETNSMQWGLAAVHV